MTINGVGALLMAGVLLCAGCGKQVDDEEFKLGIVGADIEYVCSPVDYAWFSNGIQGSSIWGEWQVPFCMGDCSDHAILKDEAPAKPKAALEMAYTGFTYSFKNYVCLDGVSGFIYNVAYLVEVPHKILRGLKCMDGVGRYVNGLFRLTWGSCCAVVGLVAAPVINTICHPAETLANLTAGLVYIDTQNTTVPWTCYVFHTNILSSLRDLIWGAIVVPILHLLTFFI